MKNKPAPPRGRKLEQGERVVVVIGFDRARRAGGPGQVRGVFRGRVVRAHRRGAIVTIYAPVMNTVSTLRERIFRVRRGNGVGSWLGDRRSESAYCGGGSSLTVSASSYSTQLTFSCLEIQATQLISEFLALSAVFRPKPRANNEYLSAEAQRNSCVSAL